jgi:cytochrome c oxidase subunit 3
LLEKKYIKIINYNNFQAHPYHLVEPSPWPILTSFALLTLTVSAVMYLHGYENGGNLLILGFLLTAFSMVLWFRDVILEGTFLGNHTKEVQAGLILGFALFIISEVMAFFSVFWAFFHASLSPDVFVGSSWPPLGIDSLNPFGVPLLNTLLLLSSGAFITYSHHALINGNRRGAINGVIWTIVLAIIFTGLQYFEYSEAGFTFADSIYGTVFYASTGLHGLHVIIGTIFIIVGFVRLVLYHLTSDHHLGFEAAILYWHFVDVVWLFLFVSVYWWGGA